MPEEAVSIVALLEERVSQPASKILGSLKGIETGLHGIESTAHRAFSTLTGFFGVFAGFEAIRKALEEAKQAAKAQAGLRSALADDVGLLDDVLKKAADVQRRTTRDDDEVIKLAADLLNRGVNLSKLNSAIEATVQLSAALGRDLAGAGNEIAITFQGIVPRGIGRAIPELKKLTVEELKLGGAIDLINKKFAGRAEAFAVTPFGRVEQEQVRVNNLYEELGDVLVELQAKIMPKLVDEFEKLIEFFKSPAGRLFLDLMVRLVITMISLLPPLLAFFAARKGIDLLIVGFTKLFSVVAAGANVFSTFERSIVQGRNLKLAGSIGNLTLIAVGLGTALGVAIDRARTLLGLGGSGLTVSQMGKLIGDNLDLVTSDKSPLADLTNVQKAGYYTTQVFKSIGLGSVPLVEGADAVYDRLIKDQQFARDDKSNAGRRQAIREATAAAVSETEPLYKMLAEAQKTGTKRTLDETAQIALKALEADYSARLISTEAYLKRREELERQALEKTKASFEAQSNSLVEEVEKQTALAQSLPEGQGKLLATNRANAALRELVDVTKQLKDVDADIAALMHQQLLFRSQTLQKSAADAASRFGETTGNTASFLEGGLLMPGEAADRDAAAFLAYRDRVDEVTAAMRKLAAESNDPAFVEETERRIESLNANLSQAAITIPGTIENINASIKQTTEGPLAGFFKSVIGGTKSVGQAFGDMLSAISDKILDFVAGQAAQQFIGFFIRGSSGFVSGLASFFGFSGGGQVPGEGYGDSVPAVLSPREFVMQRSAAEYYGPAVMSAINNRAIPRGSIAGYGGLASAPQTGLFGGGGPVSGVSSGGSVLAASVAPTEDNFRRLVNGGRRAMLDFLSENADTLKGIVQR